MITRLITLMAAVLTAAIVFIQTGCGGGDQLADGGISGTGISSGPVSGIGSIITNGIHFDSDNAQVSFNGQPGNAGMIEVGMVVTVSGEFNTVEGTGAASSVEFEYTLAGRVESVSDVFEVLGQVVSVDAQTIYRNTVFSQLAAGDHVAVSGLVTANGGIRATYVEKIPAPEQQVVVGVVTGLAADRSTFRILNLNRQAAAGGAPVLPQQLVDFSQAQITGFAAAMPADGDLVRVVGTLDGNVLAAAVVSNRQQPPGGNAGDAFLLQGLVRSFSSGSHIQINGHTLQLDATTVYVNTTESAIALDDTLQVEGIIDGEGSLLASRVIRLDRPTVTIDARADSVNPATGIITVLGLPVETNPFTALEDSSSVALKPFSLHDMTAGNRLIVSGYVGPDGIVATGVERVDDMAGNDVSINGKASGLPGAPLFEVAGLSIDTGNLQDFTGFHEGTLPISGSGFFNALREGMVVEVRGAWNGSALVPAGVTITACCNFGVLDPSGVFIGGASDTLVTWDGSLYNDPLAQTAPNMTLTSANSTPFFGFPWLIHDVRAFGPGSYTFATTRGNTLHLDVAPGQVGAHLLVDWNFNLDMDIAVLWDVDGIYSGSTGSGSDLGARGYLFNLACVDGDGDGIPGIRMVDGPFTGFQPVFNLDLAGH